MQQIAPPLAQELMDTAHALADAARRAILPYFRASDLSIDSKTADFDPVTEADRAGERAMRAVLASARPEDGILGEEYDDVPSQTGLTWVLDPIDGTRGFVSGTPTWGVLVAVSGSAGPVLGVIDQPYIGERFAGGPEGGTVTGPLGETRLATRAPRALSDAVVLTTFPEVGTEAEGAAFRRVAERARLTRYGMDCYGYALLAAGQVDLVIEAGLAPYDIAAPIAVIEAAGGIVTTWDGGPAHPGGQVIAAANPEIHAEAMARLHA